MINWLVDDFNWVVVLVLSSVCVVPLSIILPICLDAWKHRKTVK